jgi:O-antigen ligase
MFKSLTLGSAKLFFLLALFVVPFSTALLNIFSGLLLVTFVLAVLMDPRLLQPLKTKPAILILVLYALLILALSYTVAPQEEAFQAISKYRKLLFLPIAIALVWNDEQLARKGFIAVIAGSAVLTLGCYLVWLDLMPFKSFSWWKMGTPDDAYAFKSYITIGVLLGFAAVACWAYFIYAKTVRMRILSVAGGVFFAFPIFLMWGRTGYVVMLCSAFGLALLRFRHSLKMLLVSLVLIPVIFVGVYSVSSVAKMRTDHLVSEIEKYSTNKELNSSGIRLTFYKAGIQMFLAHPWIGTGTASYSENFVPIARKTVPVGDEIYTERVQPHSDVVLMAVQLGVVGLALYFWLLASLALVFRKHPSYSADLLLLLCISFGVPAFFNSLMWDVTEGHWFVLLAGCLYAAARRPGASVNFMAVDSK